MALAGGALLSVGALLPWLSVYVGLESYRGVAGLNGRLLLAGGAVGAVGGVAYLWTGRPALRWGIGLLGAVLFAFASWLVVQLFAVYREIGGDPFLVGRLGPGLFVSAVGAAVLLGTLVMGPVGRAETAAPARTAASLADALRFGLALFSTCAAVVHFGVFGEHVHEYWLAGLFFAAVGVLQLAWGLLALLLRQAPALYVSGAAGNLAVIAVWALSRTVGIPVGPEAGTPEPAGFADVLTTTLEGLIVIGSIAMLRRSTVSARLPPRALVVACCALALLVVPLTVAALLTAVGATT